MILDGSGNQAISAQLQKQALTLQFGQGIYVEAVAALIAAGRVISQQLLTETATSSIFAAATYMAIAEASVKPESK